MDEQDDGVEVTTKFNQESVLLAIAEELCVMNARLERTNGRLARIYEALGEDPESEEFEDAERTAERAQEMQESMYERIGQLVEGMEPSDTSL
jgi:GTP cyclohydrolase I